MGQTSADAMDITARSRLVAMGRSVEVAMVAARPPEPTRSPRSHKAWSDHGDPHAPPAGRATPSLPCGPNISDNLSSCAKCHHTHYPTRQDDVDPLLVSPDYASKGLPHIDDKVDGGIEIALF